MTRHNHRPLLMTIVIVAAALQLVLIVVQSWAMSRYDIVVEWFNTNGPPNGAYFDIRYGPPSWFMKVMYPVIYIFHLLWLGYGLFTLWRKTPISLGYLYYDPGHMPFAIYVAYIVSLCVRIAWASLLTECDPVCTALLTGSAIASSVAFGISLKALYTVGPALYRMGLSRDVILVRAFVHNGLGLYATYELLSVMVNITGIMVAEGYTQRNASTTIVGIGALAFLIYVIIDILVVDKYTRYTISPYLVYILAHIAVLERHWYSGLVSSLSFIIVGLSIFGLAFKIVFILARARVDPEPIIMDAQSSTTALAPAPSPGYISAPAPAPILAPGQPCNNGMEILPGYATQTGMTPNSNQQLSYL